jgi:uncharacterized membrane protein
MNKMIVVVFDNERQAYEGYRALKDLHADGTITLYGDAVIAKDASGTVFVKEAADKGPLGTAVGLLTGSLVGSSSPARRRWWPRSRRSGYCRSIRAWRPPAEP